MNYEIRESNGMGKAGKFARTGSIQVVEPDGPCAYCIIKSFSYIRVSPESRLQARRKAENFVMERLRAAIADFIAECATDRDDRISPGLKRKAQELLATLPALRGERKDE